MLSYNYEERVAGTACPSEFNIVLHRQTSQGLDGVIFFIQKITLLYFCLKKAIMSIMSEANAIIHKKASQVIIASPPSNEGQTVRRRHTLKNSVDHSHTYITIRIGMMMS